VGCESERQFNRRRRYRTREFGLLARRDAHPLQRGHVEKEGFPKKEWLGQEDRKSKKFTRRQCAKFGTAERS